MRKIVIRLPSNRDFEGSVSVETEDGEVTAGPFPISGRAADSIAMAHDNPKRNPLLPFGDPPTGLYRIQGVRETGRKSGLRMDLYGRSGAIVLLPWSGDAALADAVGRFEFLIHGGAPSANGALRVTSGHFRVSDAALAELKASLAEAAPPGWATCVEDGGAALPLGNLEGGEVWSRLPEAIRPTRAALAVTVGEYSPTDEPDLGEPRVDVDPQTDAPSIADQAGDELLSAARDLGLETLNTYGGEPVPTEGVTWAEPAAQLAGGLAGAAELYANGQTDAAVDALKETITETIPGVAAVVAVDALAPTLVEATVAVGVSTAVAGLTLSTGAILVTSAAVAVGAAATVAMGAEKVAEVCIKLAKDHL